MGTEHKLKGVDVQLGPVVGPLGRAPEAGRNWEASRPTLSWQVLLSARLSRVSKMLVSWHVRSITS